MREETATVSERGAGATATGPHDPHRGGATNRRMPVLLPLVLGTGATLAAPLAAAATDGSISAMELLSDPTEVTGTPWYVGGISTLNLWAWAVGLALYLVVARGGRGRDPRLASASGWFAALTAVVLLDDRFLLHEVVLPWLLGIPETVAFGAYGLLLAGILLRYGGTLLRRPERAVFVLALVSLAVSVVLDVAGWDSLLRRIVEEAAKLVGALAWASFPACVLLRWLRHTRIEA